MCNIEYVKLSGYIKAELEEMLGPVNRYFAGLALGRDPTNEEAVWHYIKSGGPQDFRRRWEQTHKRIPQNALS